MNTNLGRLQWAVRGVLALGVAASITANILHAQPNIIAQCIAAWPPLALLITVELVSRIPIYRRALGYVRIIATTTIAGIAAWVSYWHMAGVVSRYGETGSVPYLLPLSVDGLIVAASVSLVELAGRVHATAVDSAAVPVTEATFQQASPGDASGDMIPTPPAPTMEHDGEPTDARVGGGHQDDETELAAKAGAGETPLPDEPGQERADLAAALVPLMPAARAARDQLLHEGAALSRDALATRLRRNGTPLRNTRVSELLAAVKAESEPVNGHRPKASV